MILLTSTSDAIRVVTTQALVTHVQASFVDLDTSTSAVTPDLENTVISTATTTTVVPSPGSGVSRTLKTLSIRNVSSTTTQGVTVEHTNGTTVGIIEVQLAPRSSLFYDEHHGWSVRDAFGRLMTYAQGGGLPATTSAMTTVVLASDVTNNNAVANTIQDVTGLGFSVVTGETYYFKFVVQYTAAATATGSRWSITGPTATALRYSSMYSLTTTTFTFNTGLAAYDLPAASNATSAATTANTAIIEGFITPSADGTVTARFASEVASSAIVAKAGSICQYMRVL